MGVRDWNIDKVFNHFARKFFPVPLGVEAGSTLSSGSLCSIVVPFDGKIVSIVSNVQTVSGSLNFDVVNGATSVVASTTLSSTGSVTHTLSSETVSDGDVLNLRISKDSTEFARGGITVEIRPLLGDELSSPIAES